MPTSTVGSERYPAAPAAGGFTLVELLVVLAIMAFASIAVAPSLESLLAPRPRLSDPEKLVAALARARDEAILQGQTFRGAMYTDERGLQDAEGKTLYEPPANLAIGPASDEPLPCVFRPDGSGCSLALQLTRGEDEWRVQVNPLTGRVRLLRSR